MRDGGQNNKYKRNNSDQSQRNETTQDAQTTTTWILQNQQHTGQISTVYVGRHCCWRLSPPFFFCVFHPLLFCLISPCCWAEQEKRRKQVYNPSHASLIPFFVLSVFFYLFFFRFLSFASISLFLQFAMSHCNHTSCMSQYCWAPCVTINISCNSQTKEARPHFFFQSSHKKRKTKREKKKKTNWQEQEMPMKDEGVILSITDRTRKHLH